jgi:expansin (peptidoglycan-binding protein)
MGIAKIFTILPLAFALALAAPTITSEDGLEPLDFRGSVTYYKTGLGACGDTNNDGEMVAAVSHVVYDAYPVCGKKIRVVGRGGGSAVVKVVDRCAGCAIHDLDLSPTAFKAAIGDLSIGRQDASWDWA